MINFIFNPERLRVDTEIKIIEQDGTEIIVPVIITVKVDKFNEKQQNYIYKIVYNLFNKKFNIDKRPKPNVIKKPFWKFW